MNTEAQLIEVQALPALPPSATEAARKLRDDLLAKARKGVAITTPEAAVKAAAFLKELTAFTRTIEDTRKVVKAPVLELSKKIDATASELVDPIEAEAKRIGNMLAQFQADQKKREEESRRLAYEEQERIRREAEERERKIREEAAAKRRALNDERNAAIRAIMPNTTWSEYADMTAETFALEIQIVTKRKADQDRLAAEAAKARSAKAKEEAERKQREAAEAEEKRQREAADLAEKQRLEREARERQEAAERARQAEQTAARAAQTAIVAPAPKLTGVAMGSDLKFEVTDIHALFEALPGMVLLTPNNAAIKAHLKTLGEGQTLPGVRHWREAKTTVRG